MNPLTTVQIVAVTETNDFTYGFGALLVYDYILCIREEVEYFWTGSWSLSRALYLAIRYMSLGYAFFSITIPDIFIAGTFSEPIFMTRFYVFVLPTTILCQSVITLRVWFLYSRNPVVRIFSAILLIACTAATFTLFILLWHIIRFDTLNPQLPASPVTALLYVPSLVLHTILFALKVYRFLTSSVKTQTDSLLWRFVKEGMFMYACASVSLLFGVIGLIMVDPSQITLRTPAEVGSPVLASIVISVCRAMLSIRSVAATSHVDPEWLLNHAELSRVHWRRGSTAGEIVVEASGPAIPLSAKYL